MASIVGVELVVVVAAFAVVLAAVATPVQDVLASPLVGQAVFGSVEVAVGLAVLIDLAVPFLVLVA